MPLTSTFIPSPADVERYKRLRGLARDLNHRIVQTIPREAIPQVAEAIGVLHGGVLVLESEEESNVLMDCCLYDWIPEGKNLVEKYAENHPPAPGTEEQELFIMDMGLSQTPLDAAYAIRTLPLGQFWMTSGAGLPTGSGAIKNAMDRLSKQRLLEEGRFTEPHKVALVFVRTLLESGASQHVAYETVENQRRQEFHSEFDGADLPQQKMSAYAPSRNSPCPCGSEKRYKRCCGARV